MCPYKRFFEYESSKNEEKLCWYSMDSFLPFLLICSLNTMSFRQLYWSRPFPTNTLALNVISECYNITFNYNDVYNHYLKSRYFPYKSSSGWRNNYTNFIFAAYQMNLYTLWHEIAKSGNKHLTLEVFTKMLCRYEFASLGILCNFVYKFYRHLMILAERRNLHSRRC